MARKHVVIDIETENTGADIMKDNKRIISVQLGNDSDQELYYADSKDSHFAFDRARMRIVSLTAQGYSFAGYNINAFDIPLLKRFLNIEIPDANILELSLVDHVINLKRRLCRKSLSLEEVCEKFGIKTKHKENLAKKSEEYMRRPYILEQAGKEGARLAREENWSMDFSVNLALKRIARGHAILDAYNEFVERDGEKNTLFYGYAIADVICEFKLLKALGQDQWRSRPCQSKSV